MNIRFPDTDPKNLRLLLYSLLIGAVTGVSGSFFRMLINKADQVRALIFSGAGDHGIASWLWPVLFSIAGVSIAIYLVRKFAPETSGSGVHEIEGALDGIRPMRWSRVLPVKFFASLFSLGSGLLLGREGPTIQIGANIGRMVKDIFREPEDESNTLVSAGAAAGLASAFNAPFAGIIFVIEEMHAHFKFSFYSVAAVMIGSCTSDYVVRLMVGSEPVISMNMLTTQSLSGSWLFIILGLLFGFIGLLYNKMLVLSLDIFGKLKDKPVLLTGVVVGLVIGVVGIFYPDMIGGGYLTISEVLEHSFSLGLLLVIFLVRLLLSVFSYGSGAPGGIFAPMLTLGVITGMLFGYLAQSLLPGMLIHPGVFAVAGMAGIFASTVRAPLTGLVLAVEMTSDFQLILPLMVTTVTASVFTSVIGNMPIYTTLLKRLLAGSEEQREITEQLSGQD